jgi:hypothetical protein
MRIKLSSVYVNDLDLGLTFYTEVRHLRQLHPALSIHVKPIRLSSFLGCFVSRLNGEILFTRQCQSVL